MQMGKLLSVCMIALLFVGWGITPGALAQESEQVDQEAVNQGGEDVDNEETAAPAAEGEVVFNQTLGAGSNRADKFRLTCFAGCACARASLFDFFDNNPNRFGVNLVGDFDAGDGSFFSGISRVSTPFPNGFSATAQVCQGPGQYEVDVYKNTAFAEAYQANLRCVFANGVPCGHQVVIIQNQ